MLTMEGEANENGRRSEGGHECRLDHHRVSRRRSRNRRAPDPRPGRSISSSERHTAGNPSAVDTPARFAYARTRPGRNALHDPWPGAPVVARRSSRACEHRTKPGRSKVAVTTVSTSNEAPRPPAWRKLLGCRCRFCGSVHGPRSARDQLRARWRVGRRVDTANRGATDSPA